MRDVAVVSVCVWCHPSPVYVYICVCDVTPHHCCVLMSVGESSRESTFAKRYTYEGSAVGVKTDPRERILLAARSW